MRASASPNAAWRPDAAVSGPVGFADTNSTWMRSPCSPAPKRSPVPSTSATAPTYHASDRKRLRNPGPATSTRSTRSPSRACSEAPSFSAMARGGSPSAGASSIAAFVE